MVSEEIIKACLKRNRKAQFELFKLCYGFLMAICRRYHSNKDDAEAILNTAFLKILDNLKKYRPEVPFKLWIRRIMINTIIDDHRKNKRYKEQINLHDYDVSHDTNADFNISDLELDANYLYKMLDNLPATSKKVFCLFAIDGYQHNEIAKMMDMSEGTSKWHVSNARSILKDMLMTVDRKKSLKAI